LNLPTRDANIRISISMRGWVHKATHAL
jgi:hypothetical protein